MSVDLLSVALRALAFVALFQAAGVAAFLALLDHPLRATDPALRRLGVLTAVIAAMLLACQYVLEAARMSGEFSGALDPSLQRIVIRSAMSVTLAWRLLGLLLIALGLRRGGAGGTAVSVAGAVILLAAFTLVGHTSNAPLRWLLSPVLLAHLAVVAFWFGALLPLYLVTLHEGAEASGRIVGQFSARALWLVPGLLLAGLVLASLLLPDLAALRRPYGELLIVKVLAFCALMVLAAANKWRFAPELSRGDAAAGRCFRYSLAAEYILIAGVLCVTAVLTTFYAPDPH
jgi:putative copper resistance protein D